MSGTKRAHEDGADRPAKSKRARYVAIACDECKRRKVKCGGQVPCERCFDLEVACVYQQDNRERSKDSQMLEGMNCQMQVIQGKLDKVVDYIFHGQHSGMTTETSHKYNDYGSDILRPKRRAHSSGCLDQPQSLCPGFRGPTSSSFIFDVANVSLKKMGLSPDGSNIESITSRENVPPTPPCQQREAGGPLIRLHREDPLWQVGVAEALRLCKIYEESFGIMHPVLDLPHLVSHARLVFTPPGTSVVPDPRKSSAALPEQSHNLDTSLLKLVCAISLASSSCGEFEEAERLYQSIEEAADDPIWDSMGLEGIQYLILVALYHVQIGQDVRASRIIGLAARLCLETGLNRREVLLKTFPKEQDRDLAVRIFWSVYMLDMRASCGTGIPFVIQDVDIDPRLPEPGCSHLFLKTMIGFARLSGKVWRVVNTFSNAENDFTTDSIEFLDYQVLQWQKRIPECLRYDPSDTDPVATRNEPLFIRAVTYARTNQLRNLIYRRVLYSTARIEQHTTYAQTVVDIAKKTVSFLATLNHATDIYQAQPVVFNHFLVSALGVLLLAVANAPDYFSHNVRDEYYMALALLKESAMKSQVLMRLWKTVEGLEELGPTLGLARPCSPDQSHIETGADACELEYIPEKIASIDSNHYAVPTAGGVGLRDDFANLFGFTGDFTNHPIFLPHDTNVTNIYSTNISDIFGGGSGGESNEDEISRHIRGFL